MCKTVNVRAGHHDKSLHLQHVSGHVCNAPDASIHFFSNACMKVAVGNLNDCVEDCY